MKRYLFKYYALEKVAKAVKSNWWSFWKPAVVITENVWKEQSFEITEKEAQFLKETFERGIEPQQSLFIKMLNRGERDSIKDMETIVNDNIGPFMIMKEKQ